MCGYFLNSNYIRNQPPQLRPRSVAGRSARIHSCQSHMVPWLPWQIVWRVALVAAKLRPAVRSGRAKAGQGRWDLAQLAGPAALLLQPPCLPARLPMHHPCHHQPQDQAIGAANQRLGRAARPTTNPGTTAQATPAQLLSRRRPAPKALLSPLGWLSGLRWRRVR